MKRSRKAPQECSPWREPWEEARNRQAPAGRKSGSQAMRFQDDAFLDLVVILVAIIVAQVLGGAEGLSVIGVTNFDLSIYVLDPDMGSAAAEFAAQVVPDELMMSHVQAKIIVDSARHG